MDDLIIVLDEETSDPVSVEYISSIFADIAALEPQDLDQFKLAFDDFDTEELEAFRNNMRKVTNNLSVYMRKMKGYVNPTDVKRHMERMEAKRQKKLLLTRTEIASGVKLTDGA